MLQKFNFSKNEFKKLVIMCHLGQFMRNGNYIHGDKEYDEDFDKILDYLAEFAEENGMKDYVKDFGNGKLERNNELDILSYEFINNYDEFSFWDELAEKMAEKDFCKKYGRFPDFRNNEEDRNKFYEIRDMYEDEFSENGLDNLGLVNEYN